jgi:hypothetical protein
MSRGRNERNAEARRRCDRKRVGRQWNAKSRVELVSVNLTVNCQSRTIALEPRTTLLDALREVPVRECLDRGAPTVVTKALCLLANSLIPWLSLFSAAASATGYPVRRRSRR